MSAGNSNRLVPRTVKRQLLRSLEERQLWGRVALFYGDWSRAGWIVYCINTQYSQFNYCKTEYNHEGGVESIDSIVMVIIRSSESELNL